jgi:hypothetical protein
MIHRILVRKDSQKPRLIITLNTTMETFTGKDKIKDRQLHMDMEKIHTNPIQTTMAWK